MRLDVPTLLVAAVLVTGVAGALLVFSWHQSRRLTGLVWWGGGTLMASLAAALLSLRGIIPDALSIDAANAVLLLAHGVFWSGARVFEGRRLRPAWAMAGAALWLAACQIPSFYESMAARVCLSSSLACLYTLALASEFWRGRDERLASRYPAMALMGLHAAVCLARVPFALLFPFPPDGRTLQTPWIAFLALESMLYGVGMAFVLLAMAKERAEREQHVAASTDELTGVANRRAFLARAAQCLSETPPGRPLSLVLFDLDHFKAVNDSFGHEAGDRVLIVFCRAALAHLGPDAVLGRLGGEEFACLMPGRTARETLALAERIRAEFVDLRFAGPSGAFSATFSAGVADAREAGRNLSALLSAADRALYRAKAGGRDRVEGPALVARAA